MLEAIFTATPRWYNLGLRLGLKASLLDTISTKWQGDPAACLREMLKEWLKQGSKTWQLLVKALSSTAVGERALANTLKAKHCIKLDPIRVDQGKKQPKTAYRCLMAVIFQSKSTCPPQMATKTQWQVRQCACSADPVRLQTRRSVVASESSTALPLGSIAVK